MTTRPKLIIGTRRSPLALAQTHVVRDRLVAAHPELAGHIEIKAFTTTGDAIQHGVLTEIGGKGLFTKELDEAMEQGLIDLAVHSMKDVPTVLSPELEIHCILEREDPRDALLCGRARFLGDLPAGSVVGTAGLRRAAQVLRNFPHLKVKPLRGNVQTRMKKLADGVVDATLLAMAGLNRLGLTHHVAAVLDTQTMVPALGQGAIGVTCRREETTILRALGPLKHEETVARLRCERAFLAALNGSCRTPIAGLADIKEDQLFFRGLVLRPDGRNAIAVERCGAVEEAITLANDAAAEVRCLAPADMLDEIVAPPRF